MTETKAVAVDEKKPVAVQEKKPPLAIGVVPSTMEDVFRLAQYLAKSEMVPKAYRGKPENIVAAVLLGADVGLKPMVALRFVADINGRPSLWGDAIPALVMQHRDFRGMREYYEPENGPLEQQTAVCVMVRHGVGEVKRTFSWADAVKAGLSTKDTYKQYGKRMIQMRARGFCARDAFPDALLGLSVAEEEADRAPPKVINPDGESYDPADELASRDDEFRHGAEDVQQPALPQSTGAQGSLVPEVQGGLTDAQMDDIENTLADKALQAKGTAAQKAAVVTKYFSEMLPQWDAVATDNQIARLAKSRDAVLDELKK